MNQIGRIMPTLSKMSRKLVGRLQDPRRDFRSSFRLLTASAAFITFFLALSGVHFGYVVLAPGPAPDVGKLTKIEATTYASKGSFHMTTALIDYPDGVDFRSAIHAWLDPQRELIPREFVFPKSQTREEADAEHVAQMTESQEAAVLAALKELGIPPTDDGALILSTAKKSPAHKTLKAGDVIVAVDRKPVVKVTDLAGLLAGRKPGDTVTLGIRRDGQPIDVLVQTIESPKEPGKTLVGVVVRQSRRLPIKVKVDARDIGGPSAGLMFALAIYDALTPEDLTKGHKIAGTGTIDGETGVVGPIGGIEQKVIGAKRLGADIFIAPDQDLEGARAAADKGMRVIGVSNLREAIAALRRIR